MAHDTITLRDENLSLKQRCAQQATTLTRLNTKLLMINEHVRRIGPGFATEMDALEKARMTQSVIDGLARRNRGLSDKLRHTEEAARHKAEKDANYRRRPRTPSSRGCELCAR